MSDEKRLLGVIGLCRGAGKAIIGTDMICDHLRRQGGGSVIVIEASDTSENTAKKIADKCAFYNAEHVKIKSDCITLGGALGKSAVAAVAIADEGFCRAIRKQLDAAKTDSPETTSSH